MTLYRLFMLAAIPPLLGACTMVGGPARHGGPPATEPAPVPAAEPHGSADAGTAAPDDEGAAPTLVTDQVVEVALESIGTPYLWGGTSEDGFDCSGLIQFAYAQVGVRIPRVSRAQIRAGSPVAPDPGLLRPGDVLGFADDGAGATDHVGLYIGDGEFIHSSSSGVRISEITDPFWRARLVAARRIVG
jgi:cell wall-associated NlpC family hydrolase